MSQTFKALQVTQPEKKVFERHIIERSVDDLPEGELLVQVHYSSLNFKDALSATGNPGLRAITPTLQGSTPRVKWWSAATAASTPVKR